MSYQHWTASDRLIADGVPPPALIMALLRQMDEVAALGAFTHAAREVRARSATPDGRLPDDPASVRQPRIVYDEGFEPGLPDYEPLPAEREALAALHPRTP